MTTLNQTLTAARSDVFGIAAAIALGLALVFFAGLSQATVLHDAAHDGRHSIAFPCH